MIESRWKERELCFGAHDIQVKAKDKKELMMKQHPRHNNVHIQEMVVDGLSTGLDL